MKIITALLALSISLAALSQEKPICKAFDEGCWTLIGASNGVELYVTYKSFYLPGKYRIAAYTKIVNTNKYAVISSSDVSTSFYNPSSPSDAFFVKSIPMDKSLDDRQTIVRYVDFFSNEKDVLFSPIKSFHFDPTPPAK